MPKFVYTPQGAEPKSWDFDPMKLPSPECMAIERLTEMTFMEWLDAFQRGSTIAIHAALYVLLKRDRPTLEPDQVQFTHDEWDIEVDKSAPKARKAATPKSA